MAHGGAREGAGRPRADANGQERRKHSIYCTKDELQEARGFLNRLRDEAAEAAEAAKQNDELKSERYEYDMGETVASFRDWDSDTKLARLNDLVERNPDSQHSVELHFVDGRRGTKDIVMTLSNVVRVEKLFTCMPDKWAFLDCNDGPVGTLDLSEVKNLKYFFFPDRKYSNLIVCIEAICLDDGYDD